MIRIELNPVSLKYQTITEARELYLELYEMYIKYVVKFDATEPILPDDESSGWENVTTDIEIVALKKDIVGIEKTRLDRSLCWKVSVLVNGFASDLQIFFKRRGEAEDVYKKLFNYIT